MGVELIFRIAGIGMVIAILATLLKQTGRDDIATLVALAGLVIVLLMIVEQVGTLFESVKRIFNLY